MAKTTGIGRKQQNRFVWFSLAPMLLLFGVFSIFPIVFNLIVSFFNFNLFNPANSQFVGFGNYIGLPKLDRFGMIMRNTFFFASVSVIANIVLSLGVCLAINSLRGTRAKSFFRTSFFLPVVLPVVAVAKIWQVMFDAQSGIVNRFIKMFGVAENIYWLANPETAMYAVIVVTLFMDLGYNIVLFLAGMEGIPRTFIEAARIDGANEFTLFRKMIIPLMSRTTLFIFIMTTISYFQAFGQINIMTKGGPDRATEILSYSIYRYAFALSSPMMSTAATLAVLLLVIILLVSVIQLIVGKSDWDYD